MERMGIIKHLNSFASKLWEEFQHILNHACIMVLLMTVVAALNWLFERMLPTEFGKSLHRIEYILYILIIILFGISTIVQLLMTLIELVQHRLREIRKPLNIIISNVDGKEVILSGKDVLANLSDPDIQQSESE